MKIFRLSRSRAALLGAFLLPILASCGGGGGSSGPKTSDANTNRPAPTDGNSNCALTFAPNYASSVSLLRWPVFPLRVFFVQNDQFSEARRDTASAGFNRWVSASGGRADYTEVSERDKANVVVSFYRFTGGPGDTLGTTTVTYSENDGVIRSAKIEIGITGDRNDDILTAAHEYGHTLGISGHSPSDLDLMFFSGNRSGEVTSPDLNTARTAYCDAFNRSTGRTKAATGPLKTIVMH